MLEYIGFFGMFLVVPCFTLLCLARLVVLLRDWSFASYRVLRLLGLVLMFGLQLCCYLGFYPYILMDVLHF